MKIFSFVFAGFSGAFPLLFIARAAEKSAAGTDGFGFGGAALLIATALFMVMRTWRISAKNRKRFGKGFVFKRRSFARKSRPDDYDDLPRGYGNALDSDNKNNGGRD